MTAWDDLPFYDHDPDAKEQATEASRERVKEGFTKLLAAFQGPVNEERARDQETRRAQFRKSNAFHDAREDRPLWFRLGLKEPSVDA